MILEDLEGSIVQCTDGTVLCFRVELRHGEQRSSRCDVHLLSREEEGLDDVVELHGAIIKSR